MKRIVCIALCLIMAIGCFAFSVSAAANNEKLIADVSASIPDAYKSTHLPQAEKIINQLTISDDQYAQLKSILDATKAKVNLANESIHMYSDADKAYILGQFEAALAVMNLHYTTAAKANGEHKGDIIATVYDSTGKVLGTLDSDVTPNKTDSGVPTWTWILVAAAAVVVIAGVMVYDRKRKIAA